MKKISMLFCAFMFFSIFVHAQLMLGGSASILRDDNNSQLGGGVQLKVLIADRIAIGGIVRAYPKNSTEENVVLSGRPGTIRTTNALVPVAGMFEYYLGKNNNFKPYLGTDAGLYFNKHFTEYKFENASTVSQENNKSYFAVAPKGGFQVNLGGLFALFGQVQYHFLFGSGDPDNITIPGIDGASLETKPADKFWTFDAGILLRLKAAGK